MMFADPDLDERIERKVLEFFETELAPRTMRLMDLAFRAGASQERERAARAAGNLPRSAEERETIHAGGPR